jgi:hypothetical protein
MLFNSEPIWYRLYLFHLDQQLKIDIPISNAAENHRSCPYGITIKPI